MRILAIALALIIPFAFAAECQPAQPGVTITTLECADANSTSITASAEVTGVSPGSLTRRGFAFMEGTTGTPSINATPLVNPSFDEGNPPEGWDHVHQCTVARSTQQARVGSYSAEITSLPDQFGRFGMDAPLPPEQAGGRTFTFGAWVWADQPERVRLFIVDRTPDYGDARSAFHPGDGQWHWLSVTRTIKAEGLTGWAICAHHTAGEAFSYYIDGAVLVENAAFEDGQFGAGEYGLDIKGLKPNTSYRIRAFVVDGTGIRYGDTVTCTTLP